MDIIYLSLGHLAVKRIMNPIKRLFFWPNLIIEVQEYIKTCLAWNRRIMNIGQSKQSGASNCYIPWDTVAIDMCGPMTLNGKTSTSLTLIDHFTRFAPAWVIPNNITRSKI